MGHLLIWTWLRHSLGLSVIELQSFFFTSDHPRVTNLKWEMLMEDFPNI